MNRVLLVALFIFAGTEHAQDNEAAKPASMTASLNKTLRMYVFPAKDQKPEQQSAAEKAC